MLHNGVKNQSEAAEYWRYKLDKSERTGAELKRKLEKTEKDLANTKMKMKLENVGLVQQLEGSYNEVTDLHSKVYVKKLDREVSNQIDGLTLSFC